MAGGLRLLKVPVRIGVDVAGLHFSRDVLASPEPEGADHFVLPLRLPSTGEFLLRLGVLCQERHRSEQGQ